MADFWEQRYVGEGSADAHLWLTDLDGSLPGRGTRTGERIINVDEDGGKTITVVAA